MFVVVDDDAGERFDAVVFEARAEWRVVLRAGMTPSERKFALSLAEYLVNAKTSGVVIRRRVSSE